MRIKPGASIRGMKTETLLGYLIAVDVYAELGYFVDAVLTSATDGAPDRVTNSLHANGYAFDIRRPEGYNPGTLCRALRERLGTEFQVVAELDHIHIEYQP